jgi:hypothetical protein
LEVGPYRSQGYSEVKVCTKGFVISESLYSSKTKIIVLRNQSSPVGEWVSERVNVYKDYKRLFGGEPKLVQAIGLMSDSNSTGSRAVAHYEGIRVSKHW